MPRDFIIESLRSINCDDWTENTIPLHPLYLYVNRHANMKTAICRQRYYREKEKLNRLKFPDNWYR